MSFPPYDELIDSGINWLGEVPKHWKVVSIKWLSPVQRGASPRPIDDAKYFDDGGEFAWVRIADVSASNDGRLRETTQRLSELGSSLSVKIYPGEIFVSIAGTVGKPCISEIKACIHDGFVYFPHIEINRHFLFRIFEAGLCYGGLGKWGTQLNLNTDTVGSIRIPVPPEDELNAIVEFLDVETSKIDGLVSEQRRLIELLKEKRQAVISHAVTKGLNPNAPMKPSGIQWLGDVPQHWSVVPVKRVVEVKDGTHATPAYVDPSENTFPLITSKDFGEETICFDHAKHISAVDHEEVVRRSNTEQGDVLMSMIGGNIGKALIVQAERPFSIKNVALFKTNNNPTIAKYVLYYLQSGLLDVQIDLLSRGGAQGFLGLGDIRNLVFFKISSGELEEIVEELGIQVAGFTQLLAEAERAIDLLQERRTALISAAVTGKIDVREFAN